MKITLERQRDRTGCSNEWIASSDTLPRDGIGKNSTQALGSLVEANLTWFGVDTIETKDYLVQAEAITWRQYNRDMEQKDA